MKLNFLFSLLIMVFLGSCNEAKKMNSDHNNSDIFSISLNQKSDSGNKELTLYKNFYLMNIEGEKYRYDLDAEKWEAVTQILNKLEISKFSTYSSSEPEGRFVDKNKISQIKIENKNGTFSSQEITPERIPEELNELYQFLQSFFPLN